MYSKDLEALKCINDVDNKIRWFDLVDAENWNIIGKSFRQYTMFYVCVCCMKSSCIQIVQLRQIASAFIQIIESLGVAWSYMHAHDVDTSSQILCINFPSI